MITRKRKKLISKIAAYTVLIVVGVAFALPLIWLILAAFDSEAATRITVIEEFTFDNFMAILSSAEYMQGFLNSFIYSASVVLLVLLCSLFAAYPLSRYNFKMVSRISLWMLFLSSVPATALIVPVYKIFLWTNLLNKPISLILFLAASGLPYSIWMMKNFLDSVPKELEEAAWTDGASRITCLFRIIVPLMLPGIFTVGIFTFISAWSNFIVPYILLNKSGTLPASVLVYNMFGDYGVVNYGHLAAYSVLYMLPVLVMYTLAQNYMSKGFSMGGANKG